VKVSLMLLRQLEDVSILLDRLGIKHNITSGYSRGLVWGKYQQRLQYKIVINHGMAVNRFMGLIGFVQERPFKRRTRFTDKRYCDISIRGIRTIQYIGEKPVYDISVESEAFVANGTLS